MRKKSQSQYIRFNSQSDLVKRWIALILLKADLDSHFVFSRIDSDIIRGFDTSVPDERESHRCQVYGGVAGLRARNVYKP